MSYGKELILDLHDCDPDMFTRDDIRIFFLDLCEEIDMEPCKRSWWDYEGDPDEYAKAPDHLKGTSAVQFISTSNITIHTLDILKKVYINIFSCKEFDSLVAANFCAEFFKGNIIKYFTIDRE